MHRRITSISRILAIILAMWLSVCLCGCGDRDDSQETLEEVQIQKTGENSEDGGGTRQSNGKKSEGAEHSVKEAETKIYVHVCGRVNRPGVYELLPDSRVFEAIEAAGGLAPDAAPESLNEAAKVQDGQQVYVPAQGEELRASDGQSGTNVPSDEEKVNINTAPEEELMSLNGIGKARAAGIVKYREEHGDFGSIEELKEIEGIKEGIFNKIKDQITV